MTTDIEARHVPRRGYVSPEPTCDCDEPWPCDTRLALDDRDRWRDIAERLAGLLTAATDQLDWMPVTPGEVEFVEKSRAALAAYRAAREGSDGPT